MVDTLWYVLAQSVMDAALFKPDNVATWRLRTTGRLFQRGNLLRIEVGHCFSLNDRAADLIFQVTQSSLQIQHLNSFCNVILEHLLAFTLFILVARYRYAAVRIIVPPSPVK